MLYIRIEKIEVFIDTYILKASREYPTHMCMCVHRYIIGTYIFVSIHISYTYQEQKNNVVILHVQM